MTVKCPLLLLQTFQIFGFISCGYFILGPAKLEILETQNCSKDVLPMTMNFILGRFNATTQLLNTNLNIPDDLDESVAISLRSSRWSNNNWRKDFYTIEDDNACQALNKYVGPLWHDIEKQIGMIPRVCPIKSGTYKSKNLHVDINKMNIKMFFKGKFKTRVRFMRYSKPIFCKDFIILLSEK